MKRARRGVTLMEMLIAVVLFSLLSLAVMYALRLGVMTYSQTQTRLMDNRRVVGAQHIVDQELQGMIPVMAVCGAGQEGGGAKVPFFQGEPQVMRLVSTFSLQEAARGFAQILELMVVPGEEGRGVRLLVNEIPYTGPLSAGRLCTGPQKYARVEPREHAFVLADKLAYCRFSYLHVPIVEVPVPEWQRVFEARTWPRAVRVEMAPLDADPSRIQPFTITSVIRVHRNAEIPYFDY